MPNNPLVSVYCLTYNHENYIRDTLDGFVNQKTNFPFEVFVHDDASSDNTPVIIQEYATRYPDIIKPILQTENQYSKGIKIVRTFINPHIKGKYIAACEGDDYWNDINKLQILVSFLENHPEYVACVHDTLKINKKDNSIGTFITLEKDSDLKTEDIILRTGNGFFHFSSVVYKSEYLINERPEFFSKSPGVGDYPLAVYLALNGKIRYVNRIMSIYRVCVPGSWTDRNRRKDVNDIIKSRNNIVEMLKSANEYSSNRHKDIIEKAINKLLYGNLVIKGDYQSIKNTPKMYGFHRSQTIKTRISVYLKCKFIYLFTLYKKTKILLMDRFN